MFAEVRKFKHGVDNMELNSSNELRILRDLNVKNKLGILRSDLDVAPNETAGIRLVSIRPSVDYLFDNGAKRVTIIGHRGRPEGVNPELSTRFLVRPLQELLGREINFISDFNQTIDGELVLFENLRFWKGERDGDEDFAKKIVGLGDVYVSDAFGTFHRNDTSISKTPLLLPSACGIQAEKEFVVLSKLLKNPEHPFVAIAGGAKIEDKVKTIENLSKAADNVLVGGLLPLEIGRQNLKFDSRVLIASLDSSGTDIDQDSIDSFVEVIKSAKTIVWNGTVGYVEKGFVRGTDAIIQAIVDSHAYSVVGGGDTTQYLFNKSLHTSFNHVSTGGGAMLEFLSGKALPGFESLRRI